jgi:hypothetical protein
MFKTNRKNELLPGAWGYAQGLQFWARIEQDVIWPWFYLQIGENEGDDTFRSMLMIPTEALLAEFIANQQENCWLEDIQVVTPDYLNHKGRWLMEPLIELNSLRDGDGVIQGYEYVTAEGERYSTSAYDSQTLCKRSIFSSRADLSKARQP